MRPDGWVGSRERRIHASAAITSRRRERPARDDYHWIIVGSGCHHFLQPIFECFGSSTLRLWAESSISAADLTRTQCHGLVTAAGNFQGRPVAVVWSDFRVNGASFGHCNSRRFAAFLQHLDGAGTDPVPLIYVVNSAGVSLMEGRAAFADAFALWPALLRYSERHLVLTCAVGKCLGLAPLLFGLGHYRVAVTGQTHINLTGPEVLTLFFGPSVDFAQNASAERLHDRTDLVHELVPSIGAAFTRFQGLLSRFAATESGQTAGPHGKLEALLASFLDSAPQELVPGWSDSIRLFLGRRRGKAVGLFINPPGRAANLITVRTLDVYAAGLDLFRALEVPIVSFLDSPGVDPRFDQSDANNLRRMLAVGSQIIHYPHGAMGVVTGRCFGGASTLVFPKIFGGRRTVALRGSRMGTMNESIITRLLQGSPRLQSQWRQVAATQDAGLTDLLAEGSLDAVIDPADLAGEIDRFLGLDAAPHLQGAAGPGRRTMLHSPEGSSP